MRPIALLALLCFSVTASAELYTWTDAEGHKHFGDKPPADAGANAQQIEEKKAYSPGSDAKVKEVYQRTNRMFDAQDKAQREAQKKQDAADKEAAQKMKSCYDARERERKLNGRIVFVGKDGSVDKDSEKERQRELEETRQWIASHCTN